MPEPWTSMIVWVGRTPHASFTATVMDPLTDVVAPRSSASVSARSASPAGTVPAMVTVIVREGPGVPMSTVMPSGSGLSTMTSATVTSSATTRG